MILLCALLLSSIFQAGQIADQGSGKAVGLATYPFILAEYDFMICFVIV
jgi:hypothetical protein